MKTAPRSPPRLFPVIVLADGVSAIARESARCVRQAGKQMRAPVGVTLRPGPQTPLWNELVGTLRSWLKRRGEKVLLARVLGIPRQRVHDFLVGRGRMPDAERTLLMLEWLAARQRGEKPA